MTPPPGARTSSSRSQRGTACPDSSGSEERDRSVARASARGSRFALTLPAIFAAAAAITVTPAQSPQRVAAIWSYANARLDTQMDAWFTDGEFPKDIQLLRLTTALRPADYESWTNLGWMLENVEEWDAALDVYKRYEAVNKAHDPDAGLPLGQYYFRRRQYPLVPGVLAKYIDRKPHPHPNVFRILAHSYERLGKLNDAERIWKDYLAVAPNDNAAKNNLKRVEKKLGKA